MDGATGKKPQIQGLIPGLTEIGKIKIGCKGETRQGASGPWQLPVKLDHFIITTLARGADGNFLRDIDLYKRLGFDDKPREVPIILLFDDLNLNFQSRYVRYDGKTLACSGDGEAAITAEHKIIPCPCPKKDPGYKGKDKCKMHGCLSCLIAGAGTIGGVWKFRTTGYNSTVGLLSSLTLISSMTGGILAGLPLRLRVMPKVATNPDDGKSVTIYVVGVTFAGDMGELQKSALTIVQSKETYRQRLQHVEDEVRKMISVDADLIDQAGDIVDEHYPAEPPAVVLAPEIKITHEGAPEPQGPVTVASESITVGPVAIAPETITVGLIPESAPQQAGEIPKLIIPDKFNLFD